jgi:type I restriction enzyme S subunit
MSIKIKNVPSIRFSEFTENWNLVLLEDIAVRGSGHTPSKSNPEYYNGNVKWVSLADSKKLDNGYINDTKIKISIEGIKNSSAVLHPKGSVLLSRDAGVGKSAVMKEEMAVSQHFIVWKAKENILSNWYLYNILQILKPEFERIAIGNTIKTIGLPYFKKLKISIPNFVEQQKIASFLSSIDEKILRLIRKKELLEQYKKGVMQQLFSGKWRFKDEKGKAYPGWEKKPLGEIGNTFNGLTGKTKENFGVGKPYIQYKQIFDNAKIDITKCGLVQVDETENQQKVQYGDVFFTTSSETTNEIGFTSVLLEKTGDMYLNSFCFGFRPNSLEQLTPNFSVYLFRNEIFRKIIVKLAQGSTRYNMSKVELMKLEVLLPSAKEQTKIATYLSNIDNKIENVNNQITKTQTFKKGLLQQMFVKI